MYLEPPLAFLSNHSCNLNALLKSFMLEAVASVKSTSVCLVTSNCLKLVGAPLTVNAPCCPGAFPEYKSEFATVEPSVFLTNDA